MSALTLDTYEPEQSRETTLWITAAIVVVAIHIGLAVAYLRLKPEPELRAEAPAYDVAFMPAENAPAAPPTIDQPVPAPTKMDQPQDDKLPPPVPELEPPPPPQVEAMVPHEEPPPPAPTPPIPVQPEPAPVPEQATVVPTEKPPEVTVPEKPTVVPEPTPRKMIQEEKIEKEKIEREKLEKREERVEKRHAPPKSVASPGSKPMRVASAPNRGVESEGAREGRASWLHELAAHIQRFATYSTGGSRESGTAEVSVTIDRNGRLLAHRIARSGGSAALDHAALSIIERAQPYPRFPASMPEAQVTKLVPIHLRPQ